MSSFNKKTRNPGWKSGGHWVECMRTCRVIRVQDTRKEWTGSLVAKEEWEPRHPQDFIRGIPDDTQAKGYTNPEGAGTSIAPDYGLAIAGIAKAGTARAGNDRDQQETVPTGTFNLNTL